ncbi:MAG: PPOX class F420-dependent oxidoreductase [Actinomycetota bacterium]|nr:PPOX class F420-dependent oxidoreductase [Actinomycetota bacterium]
MTSAVIPEAHHDLVDMPHVGVLTTLGSDGRPQSTAVWFVRDGAEIRTSLLTTRQKYKNMAAHPKATLFVLDPANPFRTIEIRGDVSFEIDPGGALFERIVRHYGQDPDTFPAPKDGRVVLTLHPKRVVVNG